jgi:hypothetical protein
MMYPFDCLVHTLTSYCPPGHSTLTGLSPCVTSMVTLLQATTDRDGDAYSRWSLTSHLLH